MERFAAKNITTNTTTLVRTGRGLLHTITVNNPGTAWVLTVYDGVDATGTKVATVAAAAGTLIFDCIVTTGVTVVTSGTTPGDATVNFS